MKNSNGAKSVLIIDDDEDMLDTLSTFLKFEGYKTLIANDAQEGWAQFRYWKPSLVLTDLNMPGTHGSQLIYDILDKYPEADIVAMSGGYSKAGKQLDMASALGAKLILGKPIKRLDLLRAVDALIGPANEELSTL